MERPNFPPAFQRTLSPLGSAALRTPSVLHHHLWQGKGTADLMMLCCPSGVTHFTVPWSCLELKSTAWLNQMQFLVAKCIFIQWNNFRMNCLAPMGSCKCLRYERWWQHHLFPWPFIKISSNKKTGKVFKALICTLRMPTQRSLY